MTGAALVLSVVDSHNRLMHLVAVETAALHRRSGIYPALCGAEVISASMLTEPAGECRECQTRAQAGAAADRQRERAEPRRSGVSWPRRSRRGMSGRRRRPDNREGGRVGE
ncbi:MAG: hypothetical protein ACRDSL_04960 [Pseudonocardiaceae bacterium]